MTDAVYWLYFWSDIVKFCFSGLNLAINMHNKCLFVAFNEQKLVNAAQTSNAILSLTIISNE